jgi:large subunit ribosomal protein L25
MRTIAIQAESRERIGKGGARTARREGRLPGVLYGQGLNIHLTVDRREFGRAIQAAAGENIIFDLTMPGEAPLKSIARDVQRHPVSRDLVHVDFQHIDMNKPVTVGIVVHLLGEPEGVKNFGGILEHPSRELEVSCLPANIPSHIDVDVSHLMVGDSIHVSDLPSSGFEFLDEPGRVVVHVAAPTVEKVVEEGEEGAEGAEGEGAEGAEGAEAGDGESKEDGGGS